jgi:hypothetical protein
MMLKAEQTKNELIATTVARIHAKLAPEMAD